MSYATQQDMIDAFAEKELIQLTDRHDTGAIDAAVLAKALADADATIDGYLQGRYTLPLPHVPVILNRLARDIARYFLYDNAATEQVTKRYDDAISILQNLSTGKVTLGLDAAQIPTPTTGGPQVTGGDRVFTEDTLGDY